MGPFGVKLLTREGPPWFNRAELQIRVFARLDAPFHVEEKEFLLTRNGQSVMNIFTASGNRVSICIFTS
jgi:hypothetical protein